MTIITHLTEPQIKMLEETFARLTPEGWRIPQWVQNARKHHQEKEDERAREENRGDVVTGS